MHRNRGRLILWLYMLAHMRGPFMVVMLGAVVLRVVFMLSLFALGTRSWSSTVRALVMMLFMMMPGILWMVLMSMIMPIMMRLMLMMVPTRRRALLVM